MVDDTKITEESLGVKDTQESTIPVQYTETHADQMAQVDEYEEKMKKLAEVAESGDQITDGERENFLGWKRRKTIDMLNNEPKIKILIPFQIGEDRNVPANQYHFFGINGVWIKVKKGDYVDVPLSVFSLYQESIREPSASESKASENLVGNMGLKFDPTTGRQKSSDALHY